MRAIVKNQEYDMADDNMTAPAATTMKTGTAKKTPTKKAASSKVSAKGSAHSVTKPKATAKPKSAPTAKLTTARKTSTRKVGAQLPAVASPAGAQNAGPNGKAANTPAKEYLTMATEKAGNYATEIKDRASDAVTNISKIIEDTAGLIDDNIGVKYGDYARNASRSIHDAAEKLRAKNVTEIGQDTREFVRKRPAVAAGIAAIAGLAIVQTLRSVFRSNDD